MTKNDVADFENSTKCSIYDNVYVDNDVKRKDHCRVTGKYRDSANGDRNISIKLNHKIPVLFCNLKYYDSHVIMKELGKLNFEINVIPNELEKYMWFNIKAAFNF